MKPFLYIIVCVIISIIFGILIASAVFVYYIEDFTYNTEKFIDRCNNYFGQENWKVIKDKNNTWTCSAINQSRYLTIPMKGVP